MEGVIFPLYTLPNLAMIDVMLQADIVQISLTEHFQKQTFRSRFEIMGPNKRQVLSIPLQKGKTTCTTAQVKISYDEPWQRKHWQAIETAYLNSPFFEYYDYKLKPIFFMEATYLWEYNLALLKLVFAFLKVEKKLELVSALPNYDELSYKNNIEYDQVFSDKLGFMPNLSVIDWIFNQGA